MLLDSGAEPYPLEEELNETPLSLAAGFWFNAKRAQDDDERETLQRLLLMLDEDTRHKERQRRFDKNNE